MIYNSTATYEALMASQEGTAFYTLRDYFRDLSYCDSRKTDIYDDVVTTLALSPLLFRPNISVTRYIINEHNPDATEVTCLPTNVLRSTGVIRDDTETRDVYYSVAFVNILGNITDFFENILPNNRPRDTVYNLEDEAVTVEWQELNNISLLLKSSPRHRIRCYKVTADNRIAFIIYSGGRKHREDDYLIFRKFFAAFPGLIGLYNEDPLTILLRKLANDDQAGDYLSALNNFLLRQPEITQYETLKFKRQIKAIADSKLRRLRQEVTAQTERVNSILNQYSSALEELEQSNNNLLSASQNTTSEQDIDYLVDNKIISSILLYNNDKLSFDIKATLTNFEQTQAEAMYNTLTTDYFENTVGVGISELNLERIRTLFKALFIDEKIRLTFKERISISIGNSRIHADTDVSYYRGYFPNPHHYHYNCWGNYGPIIVKLIRAFDLVQLFTQIQVAVGSLNLIDYPVMSKFFVDILNAIAFEEEEGIGSVLKTITFTEDETEKQYTLLEAYAMLKEEEAQ